MPDGSATAHLYRPKLVTLVAEGYSVEAFRSDVTAALTVAVVALAPLASFIPLRALAGVLVVVCWNTAEKREFVALFANWHTASVVIMTFGLTLLKDLTFGFVAGCFMAALFALIRRAIPSEDAP